MYLKDKKTRIFNKHFERTLSFYGATYNVLTAKNEKKTSGHFGQFVWSAETDASTHRRLGNAIDDLVKITGLGEALKVNLPDERKLGYTDVDFSLTFTEEQTKKMIDSAELYGMKKIAANAAAKARAYFKVTDDADQICEVVTSNDQPNNCPADTESQSYSGAEEMVSKLKLMKKNWNDEKEFVKTYADFGKIISRNQFLFQSAMELAGSDVAMNYSIKGRNVSNYQVNFTTTSKLGQLVKRAGNTDLQNSGDHHHEDGVVIVFGRPGAIIPVKN